MYQIFPDRFAFSGVAKAEVPSGRILRTIGAGSRSGGRTTTDRCATTTTISRGFGRHRKPAGSSWRNWASPAFCLNPIFEAHSNHRYDTADYTRVDPLLGMKRLSLPGPGGCPAGHTHCARQGVQPHRGGQPVFQPGRGVIRTRGLWFPFFSYAGWYHFRRWPEEYDSWWGFDTLPEVREENPDYQAFITGGDGVVRSWLRRGGGWRLDVADELPDAFLDALRAAAKAEKPDALIRRSVGGRQQ